MSDNNHTSAVIATYVDDAGTLFEIVHLDRTTPDRRGEFAVYRDAVRVAEFDYVVALPEPDTETLVALARQAVAAATPALAPTRTPVAEAARNALVWLTLAVALVGGVAATASFLGAVIAGVVGRCGGGSHWC